MFGCELDDDMKKLIPDFEEIKKKWDPVIGDRETNLVFIGKQINQKEIEDTLD